MDEEKERQEEVREKLEGGGLDPDEFDEVAEAFVKFAKEQKFSFWK